MDKTKEVAKQLRLIDDDFLRLYFNDNREGIEFVLRILLQRNDLKVIASETQREYKSESGRSIYLDIYAEDQLGKKINIEMQRSNAGAVPQRARYYSSMLDNKLLKKGDDFIDLAETFVIFITENDVIKRGLPLYHFERRCTETGDYLNDESHIIYVNATYQNPHDAIGRLMHDFMCVKADEMYNEELAERFRFFKETEGGFSQMCKLIEDRVNEVQIENIKSLLAMNKLTHEEIAEALKVSLELVKQVASGKVA